MSLLAPAGLWLGLLAVPIVILYLLRLRRKEAPVSSLLLWEPLLRQHQADRPWQKLRRNLLLWLQLAILAGLSLALARPALPAPAIAGEQITLVLDASASMNTLEKGRTRFASAQAAAETLIRNASPEARFTLILASRQPQVLIASDYQRSAVLAALRAARPTQGSINWPAVFGLAAASGAEGNIVLLSDGGIYASPLPSDSSSLPTEPELPALPGKVQYLPIGEARENLAVSALALRPALDGLELLVEVSSYGEQKKSVLLAIYRNGQLLEARPLEFPGTGQPVSFIFSRLPLEPARYEARLLPAAGAAPGLDALPLDDAAYAVFQPQPALHARLYPSRLEPQSAYNFFLQQALRALLGTDRLTLHAPGSTDPLQPTSAPASNSEEVLPLTIFDGWLPDMTRRGDWPPGALLLINPPDNPLLHVTGVFTPGQAQVLPGTLTAGLDWSNVHIRQARRVQVPTWARSWVQTDEGPLVLSGETGGRFVTILTFDLHDSDLPLQVAFPILLSNWLDEVRQNAGAGQTLGVQAPAGEVEEFMQPGQTVRIRARFDTPSQASAGIQVVQPDGNTIRLAFDPQEMIFLDTGQIGFYRVLAGRQTREFAANLFDPRESDIQPRSRLLLGQTNLAALPLEHSGRNEIWPWLAGMALVILVLEWWLYHSNR